ncbi:MAG: N-acyl-D-amino-acid deacylase family protein [Chloroflexota bacterium]
MLDLLIRDGTIIDGTGAKPYRGDLAISGDRVVEIGHLGEVQAERVLNANGMAVAPGFIDIHSHHDLYLVDQDPVLRFESFVRQGVTTCVIGNCGWTLAPCLPETKHMVLDLIRSMGVPVERFYWNTMAEYLEYVEEQGLICNVAHLAGHGTIRLSVMGDDNRFCRPDELARMQDLLRECMEAGCIGVSTGLMYYPGMYAHTDELVEMAMVAGEYGGRYATHLRGYCSTLPDSLTEAITIAEKAQVPLQVSHLHAVPFLGQAADLLYHSINLFETVNRVIPIPGLPNAALQKALALIAKALARGLDVGVDAVPYTLGNTTATVLFPPWANKGGKARLLERLRDPALRRRMEEDIRTTVPKWPHWEEGSWSDPYIRAIGWKPINVLSVKSDQNRWAEGKSLAEVARHWQTDPFSGLVKLMLEEDGEVTFTFGYPARPWIEKMFNEMLRFPPMSIGADSVLPSFGTPPPSAYGCFPRVLGHYSRDLRLFPIETAVQKMTSLSARRYRGLEGRGELTKGSFADIVVFDPQKVGEKFDPRSRPLFADGITHVFINGVPMLWAGEFHGDRRPGRLLRRTPATVRMA